MKHLSLISALLLSACTHYNSSDTSVDEAAPVTVTRLDVAIGDTISPEDYRALRPGLEAWRFINMASSVSSIAFDDSVMGGMAASEAYRVFEPDVRRIIGDNLDEVEKQLGVVRQRMPEFNYSVYAVVSPFGKSVMTVDSVILIALNHYLGEDYQGYEGFPEAVRRLKTPGRIVYDVTEAVINARCPYAYAEDVNRYAVSRIAYDGALALAVEELVAGADDASVMGWREEDLRKAQKELAVYWNDLLRRDLLYSSDPLDAARMLDATGNSMSVISDCPPRIGRWIGMGIGRAWLDSHPGATVSDLLKPSYYLNPSIMQDSGYRAN